MVDDLPGKQSILPSLMEITAAGRDQLHIKSLLTVESLPWLSSRAVQGRSNAVPISGKRSKWGATMGECRVLQSLLVFCLSSDPATRAGVQWCHGVSGSGGSEAPVNSDQSGPQALLQPWLTSLLTVISAGGSRGIWVLRCQLPQWSLLRFGFFCSLAFSQLFSPKSLFALSIFFPKGLSVCWKSRIP